MGIGAVLGGAGIASSLIGAAGSSSAASSQANAAQNATNTQLGMFNQVMGNLQPYMGAGQGALGALEFGLGLNPSYGSYAAPAGNTAGIPMGGSLAPYQQAGGGSVGVSPGAYNFAPPTDSVSLLTPQANAGQAQIAPTGGVQAFRTAGTGAPMAGPDGLTSGQFLHQFNASDLASNLAPNYQFQLGQGLGAINNEAAATGMSGNVIPGAESFAQNYAGNAYQQAFQNYTTNQQNIYGRLGNLAQLGQASSTGAASGAPLFSSGISQTIQGLGQAQAAGTVGVANALSGGIGNLGSSYLLSNLLANQGGVPLTGGGTGFNI